MSGIATHKAEVWKRASGRLVCSNRVRSRITRLRYLRMWNGRRCESRARVHGRRSGILARQPAEREATRGKGRHGHAPVNARKRDDEKPEFRQDARKIPFAGRLPQECVAAPRQAPAPTAAIVPFRADITGSQQVARNAPALPAWTIPRPETAATSAECAGRQARVCRSIDCCQCRVVRIIALHSPLCARAAAVPLPTGEPLCAQRADSPFAAT